MSSTDGFVVGERAQPIGLQGQNMIKHDWSTIGQGHRPVRVVGSSAAVGGDKRTRSLHTRTHTHTHTHTARWADDRTLFPSSFLLILSIDELFSMKMSNKQHYLMSV